MPSIGTCSRFSTRLRVQKKTKLLPIKRKTVYTTVKISDPQGHKDCKKPSVPSNRMVLINGPVKVNMKMAVLGF